MISRCKYLNIIYILQLILYNIIIQYNSVFRPTASHEQQYEKLFSVPFRLTVVGSFFQSTGNETDGAPMPLKFYSDCN